MKNYTVLFSKEGKSYFREETPICESKEPLGFYSKNISRIFWRLWNMNLVNFLDPQAYITLIESATYNAAYRHIDLWLLTYINSSYEDVKCLFFLLVCWRAIFVLQLDSLFKDVQNIGHEMPKCATACSICNVLLVPLSKQFDRIEIVRFLFIEHVAATYPSSVLGETERGANRFDLATECSSANFEPLCSRTPTVFRHLSELDHQCVL